MAICVSVCEIAGKVLVSVCCGLEISRYPLAHDGYTLAHTGCAWAQRSCAVAWRGCALAHTGFAWALRGGVSATLRLCVVTKEKMRSRIAVVSQRMAAVRFLMAAGR